MSCSSSSGSAAMSTAPSATQHVGPEVAERPRAPAAAGQREEVVEPAALVPAAPARSRTARRPRAGETSETRHGGRRSSDLPVQAPPPSTPTSAGRARARRRRRRRPRPRPSARSAWPRPARRGRSSWCRRSGRSPSAAAVPAGAASPRRAWRRAAGRATGCGGCPPRRTGSASVTGVRSGLVDHVQVERLEPLHGQRVGVVGQDVRQPQVVGVVGGHALRRRRSPRTGGRGSVSPWRSAELPAGTLSWCHARRAVLRARWLRCAAIAVREFHGLPVHALRRPRCGRAGRCRAARPCVRDTSTRWATSSSPLVRSARVSVRLGAAKPQDRGSPSGCASARSSASRCVAASVVVLAVRPLVISRSRLPRVDGAGGDRPARRRWRASLRSLLVVAVLAVAACRTLVLGRRVTGRRRRVGSPVWERGYADVG